MALCLFLLLRDAAAGPCALQATLDTEGYLLLRGLLPRPEVLSARLACTDFMDGQLGTIERAKD